MGKEKLDGLLLVGIFDRWEQVKYGAASPNAGQPVDGMFRAVVMSGPDGSVERDASFSKTDRETYEMTQFYRDISAAGGDLPGRPVAIRCSARGSAKPGQRAFANLGALKLIILTVEQAEAFGLDVPTASGPVAVRQAGDAS